DHQVKIRGFRIELGEIETGLLKHPEIKEVAVLDRESKNGDNFLCAYYVIESVRHPASGLLASALKEHLTQFLPDYMLPSYFIKLEKIPLTVNGKIDRKALSRFSISNSQYPTYNAPGNRSEEKLSAIWAEILGTQKREIGIDDDFFDIGGHSLRATIMATKIHKEFNVKLPLPEIFKNATIRALAKTITEYSHDKYVAIKPAEKKEYYILSSAQKRLYLLQQMDLENTAYNMPATIPLDGETDTKELEKVFKILIQRHESLRTSFPPVTPGGIYSGQPIQLLHDDVDFEIEYYKTGAGDGEPGGFESVSKRFFRPFEMSKAPLLRVGVIETNGAGNHGGLMMLDMHHIISDGTSQNVLRKEFFALYAGEKLSPLKRQYRDYAEWQNSAEQKELKKQQAAFWINRFSGELPVLNLPTDYPRPEMQSFEGNRSSFALNKNETDSLKETAKKNDVTLYMAIHSIFTILLSKLSGQEDIILGTPTAGRRHADLQNIIGMFVNTLAIRNYPEGEKTFKGYLGEVKENTLNAFENQEYQFEDLVENLSVNRDTGRNPVFDVMLNLLNQSESSAISTESRHSQTPGEATVNKYINTTSKFDLNLSGYEGTENIHFQLEYCTRLFKVETIERFIVYFRTILREVAGNPGVSISELEIISHEEKKQVLYDFNGFVSDYPGDRTIHELFEEQAARTPDGISVMGVEKRKGEGV
ncbi:MAG: non-ribosomal peptide synthetase, partial [bacterium]|nr:non-ribosomal peptide synthetase [bacterium]